jgi:hypothetical protein
MKTPVETKIRHAVAQKRAGTVVYAIPRFIHRASVAVWDVLPAIGNGASKTVSAIAAVLAVASVASCCL